MADPAGIVALLLARGLTLGTAESLTAGLVAATLADVPGCSQVLRGGVVAYTGDVKVDVLGVPAEQVAAGVVSEPVAAAMAAGACRVLGAQVGISTTGVAGPEPHGGEPVGSVWIAVSAHGVAVTRHLRLEGDRPAIRRQTVEACWDLLAEVLSSRE